MIKNKYIIISGTFFGLVALLHLARLVFGWQILIEGWSIPLWLSWGGLVAAGVLAVWAFWLSENRETGLKQDEPSIEPDKSDLEWYLASNEIWPQKEYHASRVNASFGLYVKVATAIVGGMAYIVVFRPENLQAEMKDLLRAGAVLNMLAGIAAIVMIGSHYFNIRRRHKAVAKSIPRHWPPKGRQWYKMAETWMTVSILIMVGFVFYLAKCWVE